MVVCDWTWTARPGRCRLALDQPFAVIGRNASADLTLSDRRVSRRHAYVQAIAGEVFCVDLGSRAGVFWGRHRRRSGWVDREEGVVIKPFRIRPGKAGGEGSGARGESAREAIRGPRSPEQRGPGILARGGRAILLEDEPPADPGGEVPPLSGPADGPRDFEVSLQPPAHADGSLGRRPARSRRDCRQRGERPLSTDRRRRRAADRPGPDPVPMRVDRVGSSTVASSPESSKGAWPREVGACPPMPSIDRPRPQVLVAPRRRRAGEVARRVGASSAGMRELADSTLVHLANLSDPMQQQARQQEQMFDQFQQVMTMIVQRFGDKHRDQMQVVREEITQIRQLSGELQSLHSRLSTPPHAPPSRPRVPPDVASPSTPRSPTAVRRPGPPRSRRPSSHRRRVACRIRGLLPHHGPRGSLRSRREDRSRVGAAAVSPEEMHGMIRRRMEALERERKSHWQRIVDLMRGPQTGPSGV